VLENLNILDYDYFFKIIEGIANSNHPFVLNIFNEILEKGFEPDTFLEGIAEHARNLLISKDPLTVKLLHLTGEIEQRFLLQSQMISDRFLINTLQIISDADVQYRTAKNKRLLVEITLIKLCYVEQMIQGNMLGTSSAEQKKNKSVESDATPLSQEVKIETKGENIELPKEAPKPSSSIKVPISLNALAKTIKPKIETPVAQVEDPVYSDYSNNKDVSADELKSAWDELIQKSTAVKGLPDILNSINEKIFETNRIQMMTASNTQKSMVEEYKMWMHRTLNQILGGKTVDLEVVLDENLATQIAKKLSPKEIFEKMVEINPKLKDLVERFDLQIKY
jgi:DNA polymerase-3 subunit gamma/tau